ncbi:MAG TPA: ABC transporter permease [Candidatus Aquicultor sp.]|jgi:ABC-2 type transport system permease protein
MRKFLVLLKKEVKELLTLQTIAPLLFTVLLFMFMGSVVGQEGKKAAARQSVFVLDQDNSATSKAAIAALSESNLNVRVYRNQDVNSVIKETQANQGTVVIVFPAGFGKDVAGAKFSQIKVYSIVGSLSFVRLGAGTSAQATAVINNYISDQIIASAAPRSDPQRFKNPVKVMPSVVVGDKTAAIGLEQVTGFIMSQSTFIPVILFIVIILAAQMIAAAVASEKENKTLETLLSAPISRATLAFAKMVASGLLALVAAVIYMFSFRYYMTGIAGSVGANSGGVVASRAIEQLGLVLTPTGYMLLGVSLFFSILCALSVALILGALAENVRSAQSLVMPLIIVVVLPYVLVLFMDINTISPWLRYLVYAIPFSHTFLATPSLFFGNYLAVLYGIAYEAAFFAVLVYIASRIFASDMILTMKLSLKRR